VIWPFSEQLRVYLEVQYVLERVLGEGGMGVVVLATERSLDRQVAIKVLRRESASDTELRERFRREARTAARLTHPNIVPLHTFGEVEGEMYFVMGFVAGETLAERLQRDGAIDAQDVRRLLAELAEALDYAHCAGIVHRDIKPENVLVDRASGRPMLTDFGIARETTQAASLTRTGVVVGTPHYMSPEQAAADSALDGRSDLYSLGVVAYKAFVGRLPFGGASFKELIVQHMTSEPAPIPVERVEADPGLAEIIRRALRKAPVERWQSGKELADALRDEAGDDNLPEALVGMESAFVGSVALFGGGAMLFLAAPLFDIGNPIEDAARAGLLAAVAVGSPFLVTWTMSIAKKLPWNRIWRLGWRAPTWWKAWWPQRFRRRGDVWDRLPLELRLLRNINTVVAISMAPQVILLAWFLSPRGQTAALNFIVHYARPGEFAVAGGMLAVALGLIVPFVVLLLRVRRRFGLTATQVRTVQGLANADPRWREARFVRFLRPALPAAPSPATDASGSPDAIRHLLRDVKIPLPAGLLDAVRSAERASIDIASEAERLRREVDPEEFDKLNRRLAGLGTGGKDADLRALLSGQRDLVMRLEERIAELGARRLRVREQLRLLHQQLLELRARGAESHEEVTGRIRALNDELRRLGEGWAEVEQVTKLI